MGVIVLVRCVLVLRCGLAVVVWYPDAGFSHKDIGPQGHVGALGGGDNRPQN